MKYIKEPLGEQHLHTVRDFISAHPGDDFHLMTPGGYVDMTAEGAADLLAGKSVPSHLGCTGYTRETPAEELLSQVIVSCNHHDGAWYIISNHPELEQSNVGMEVNMC